MSDPQYTVAAVQVPELTHMIIGLKRSFGSDISIHRNETDTAVRYGYDLACEQIIRCIYEMDQRIIPMVEGEAR